MPPIPLGIIVIAADPEFQGGVVLGREPRRDNPPPELKSVGVLGAAQLEGWVTEVARDAQLAVRSTPDPFAHLCSKWRWNLYIGDAEDVEVPAPDTMLDVAKLLYERHVGEVFPEDLLRRAAADSRSEQWARRQHARRTWAPAEVQFATEAA